MSVKIVQKTKILGATKINKQALPSGGIITTANGYRIHTFTSSGVYNSGGYTNVEYLIVAGGGAGGPWAGGGGGGVLAGNTNITSHTNFTITVGDG